eukprot:scaffold45578_cov15-Prasinocladus_malaysianus.AAC.1
MPPDTIQLVFLPMPSLMYGMYAVATRSPIQISPILPQRQRMETARRSCAEAGGPTSSSSRECPHNFVPTKQD